MASLFRSSNVVDWLAVNHLTKTKNLNQKMIHFHADVRYLRDGIPRLLKASSQCSFTDPLIVRYESPSHQFLCCGSAATAEINIDITYI